jgi:Acetyltransferase (GNAT) domain
LHISVAHEAEWRALWSRAAESTIFTSWDYHELVDRDAMLVTASLEGQAVIGAWVTPRSYPFSAYQGILSSLNQYSLRKTVMALRQFIAELVSKYERVLLKVSATDPSALAIRWLSRSGDVHAQITPEFSMVIDTTAIFPQSRDRRADLHKAANIIISDQPLGDAVFYNLLCQTFRRQGRSLWTGTDLVLTRYCDYARQNGRINHASINGQVIAATLFLRDTSTAYYVIGGNNPMWRHLGASTALVLDQIRYYHALGCRFVDLMDANDCRRGAFKASLANTIRATLKVDLQKS